jgi:hypothetical protein
VLSDEEKKAAYDSGKDLQEMEMGGGGFGGVNPSDLFAAMFGRCPLLSLLLDSLVKECTSEPPRPTHLWISSYTHLWSLFHHISHTYPSSSRLSSLSACPPASLVFHWASGLRCVGGGFGGGGGGGFRSQGNYGRRPGGNGGGFRSSRF